MKVDKVLKLTPIKSKKIMKTVTGIGMAIPASTLFANSQNEGINPSAVIDEYYKNEFEMRKQFDIKGISRFSPEERLEILQLSDDIKSFPNAFHRIINAKCDDKKPRFNGEESLMLFQETCVQIEDNPELFKRILDAKCKDGKYRFNANDCALLMDNAHFLKCYPTAFKTLLARDFNAQTLKSLILCVGDIIDDDPDIIDKALNRLSEQGQSVIKTNDIINSINDIDLENKKRIIEKERYEQLQKLEEEAQRQKEIEQKKAEHQRIMQEAANIRAEKRIARLAEEKRIREEKKEILNKQVGWVAPEVLFAKLEDAVNNNTPYILESGEELSVEKCKTIVENVKKYPRKARNIVELRYSNLQPIFNEKDCCDILSDIKIYYSPDYTGKMKQICDDEGKPFFNSEQCKEILKLQPDRREWSLEDYMDRPIRKFTADELIEILKNYSVCGFYRSTFENLLLQRDTDGQYTYTVRECIDEMINQFRPANQ